MSLIFTETVDFLIALKPRGIPTAPLQKSAGKETLCTRVFKERPGIERIEGRGAHEGGLLHRIDTETEGLVLFAKTQPAFDFLEKEMTAGRVLKEYTAVCSIGTPALSPENIPLPVWENRLKERSFGGEKIALPCRFVKAAARTSKVRALPVSTPSRHAGPVYETSFILEKTGTDNILARAFLTRGFRHQVRSALAALGLPIEGDTLYHPNPLPPFRFWANALTFRDPSSLEEKTFGFRSFRIE